MERWRMAAEYYRSGASHPEVRKAWATEGYQELSEELRINVIQGLVENFVSSILPSEIRARGLAKRQGGDKEARKVQDLFNYDFIPNSKLDEKLDMSVHDGAIYSDSFVKIGFSELPRRRFEGPESNVMVDDGSAMQLGGDMDSADSTVDQKETPWFDVIRPKNVIPAPGAMSLDESPWVAIKMRKRLSELQTNRNYTNIDRVNPMTADKESWEENPNREIELLSEKEEGIEEDGEDYLDIYEVWDLQGNMLYALAHGNYDFFIREQDWPHPGLEGYPIEHLKFKHDPESFFGISMIGDVADLQDELNITSSLMATAMKRAIPFFVYDKSAFGDKDVEAMANAQVYGFAGVETASGSPIGQHLDVFPKGASFSPDLYGVRNMIIQSIMLVSGQSDFMIGQSQKTKSATEVAATAQGMSSRLGYKKKLLLRFISNILKKTYQISRHSVTEERTIRAMGLPGANVITVTPEEIRSEMEVDLDAQIAENLGDDPVRLKVMSDAMAPLLNPQLQATAGIDFAR